MDFKIPNTRIALVDDERSFSDGVSLYLGKRGAIVHSAINLSEARVLMERFEPQVLLLDKNLAIEDGFKFINEVRRDEKFKTIPILVITGTSCFEERLSAFQLGADDLLVKPIVMSELEARIIASLRRAGNYLPVEQDIRNGNLFINIKTQQVYFQEDPVLLTETEYKIFYELILNRGQIVYRERLSKKALSTRHTGPKTLDVHIAALRKKLGSIAAKQIKTIRGRGYMMVDSTSKAV